MQRGVQQDDASAGRRRWSTRWLRWSTTRRRRRRCQATSCYSPHRRHGLHPSMKNGPTHLGMLCCPSLSSLLCFLLLLLCSYPPSPVPRLALPRLAPGLLPLLCCLLRSLCSPLYPPLHSLSLCCVCSLRPSSGRAAAALRTLAGETWPRTLPSLTTTRGVSGHRVGSYSMFAACT